MNCLNYKFTDGSEITIDEKQQATICGHTKQFAFQFWSLARKDKSLRSMWTAIFIGLCDEMHKRHGIVLEYTDYFTGVTVNHFDNLMAKAS